MKRITVKDGKVDLPDGDYICITIKRAERIIKILEEAERKISNARQTTN